MECKSENLGQYGQRSLLECVIRPTQDSDVEIRIVTWKKEGAETPMLVFNRGETTLWPRSSFAEQSWNNRNMNVSLLITNTAVQDEGVYTCMVMTDSGDQTVHTSLKVTGESLQPSVWYRRTRNSCQLISKLNHEHSFCFCYRVYILVKHRQWTSGKV